MINKAAIPFKRILKQLKDDLIGKDAHRGITLTYAWMANQFGHWALGFIPSFLLYNFFSFSEIKASLYISLFWVIFELGNFLLPLLKKRNNPFKPKWKNLAFDTFTDLTFFVLGSLSFALCVIDTTNRYLIIGIAVLIVYIIGASRYWFITKMYQFYANLPFQLRLSQWDFEISDADKLKVEEFKSSEKQGKHLLIFGCLGAGKTSLGVGILNELSIKHNRTLYVNGMKIFSSFFNNADDRIDEHQIWDWKTTSYLMIDDINPSDPIQDELITPSKLLSFIDSYTPENKENRRILKNKNVIWVLGSSQAYDKGYIQKWDQMLLDIGVNKQDIVNIVL